MVKIENGRGTKIRQPEKVLPFEEWEKGIIKCSSKQFILLWPKIVGTIQAAFQAAFYFHLIHSSFDVGTKNRS